MARIRVWVWALLVLGVFLQPVTAKRNINIVTADFMVASDFDAEGLDLQPNNSNSLRLSNINVEGATHVIPVLELGVDSEPNLRLRNNRRRRKLRRGALKLKLKSLDRRTSHTLYLSFFKREGRRMVFLESKELTLNVLGEESSHVGASCTDTDTERDICIF